MKMGSELIRELISYNPQSGNAFHKMRKDDHFIETPYRTAIHQMKVFNARFAGKEVIGINKAGYKRLSYLGKRFLLHRLIWLYMTGEWPEGEIDHIDGNRSNNKWENLRDVSHRENMRNRRIQSNNKTGVMGVSWDSGKGKFRADIRGEVGNKFLGHFSDFDEAKIARDKALIEYGYHANHGD